MRQNTLLFRSKQQQYLRFQPFRPPTQLNDTGKRYKVTSRIVFSFTPNSAAAKRVFSLLKIFFGSDRDTALADVIQTTLMLRYNKRTVGHAE